MDYLLIIASDETAAPAPDGPDFEAWMGAWIAYNTRLVEGGHWIAGASLLPTATATTVRKTADQPSQIIDGPYVETKEQLGGFFLISAADLDEALALAEAMPLPTGSVEVRPVALRPDA